MQRYEQNSDMTYEYNPYYEKNGFIGKAATSIEIPDFEKIKGELPSPIFDGHEDYIACYYKAWEIAFQHIRHPKEGTGFVSDFIDTAFNDCLFMWDSAVILLFTKYAERIYPLQKTLDNFYSHQHRDGFICRTIYEDTGHDRFTRFDPSSTGPNILAFSEWKYYENFGDKERLSEIYPALRAYHVWYRKNRTWRDGSYFSSGWGCGMDNTPRLEKKYDQAFSHGHMVWVDICFQSIINCNILIKMNSELGSPDDVSDLVEEKESLTRLVNEKLWDEESGFYYDLWKNGSLNYVKHVNAFWALHAGVCDKARLDRLVSHLENENEFNTVTPVPSLSKDHPEYRPDGGYALGSSIASTSYMTLSGLSENGYYKLCHDLAAKYLDTVVSVFNKTGTIYENYAPDFKSQGNPAKPDFVGWSGLIPISVLFEHIFGIRADVPGERVIWHVNRLERHGIEGYPFGKDNTLSLICEARTSHDEEPRITFKAKHPIKLTLIHGGKERTLVSESY